MRVDALPDGTAVGCMHPLQTFPPAETALALIPGTAFGLEGDARAVAAAQGLVAAVGAWSFPVPSDRKALYHALRRRQIGVQVNYIPVPWHPEHGSHAPEEFPGALRYYAGCLSLPLFPAMHDDDVERVVDALVEVLDEI